MGNGRNEGNDGTSEVGSGTRSSKTLTPPPIPQILNVVNRWMEPMAPIFTHFSYIPFHGYLIYLSSIPLIPPLPPLIIILLYIINRLVPLVTRYRIKKLRLVPRLVMEPVPKPMGNGRNRSINQLLPFFVLPRVCRGIQNLFPRSPAFLDWTRFQP